MGGEGNSETWPGGSGGSADVSVGAWLREFDAGGRRREAAVVQMREVALRCARSLLRRLGRRHAEPEAEDLAGHLVVVVIDKDARSLRGCSPDLPLPAWCTGSVTNLESARHQREDGAVPLSDDAQSDVPDRSASSNDLTPDSEPRTLTRKDLEGLPPEQVEAALACNGCATLREAARRAGMNWSTFLYRYKEALRRLSLPKEARGAEDRSWAPVLAEIVAREREVANATILRLWFADVRAAAIGTSLRPPLSKVAVHSRVQRLRARAVQEGLAR